MHHLANNLTDVNSIKAADEEALPFKMVYVLSYSLGLRVWIQPETCHASWNDCKNSVRRAGFQHCLLLSTVINNLGHGPYRSGQNQVTIVEAAESLVKSMSSDQFDDLVDRMAMDRGISVDDESLPKTPQDILTLPVLKTLPVFVI